MAVINIAFHLFPKFNSIQFVEKLIFIIEERLTDPQLSVEELSREMAMSRSSLHKKLKAMSGHVPNEFIRLIRLKKRS